MYFVYWSDLFLPFVALGVPLFFMLSGSLLLQPSKVDEPIRVFLKKRLARIGTAFVFWSVIYFIWDYYANHVALTPYSITQSLLQGGAYNQFWFIYAIMGLYLITPVLRMVVKTANRNILRYIIILWFMGAIVPPFVQLVTGLKIDNSLLLFGGYIGYFVLGLYLMGVKVKTKILLALLAAGLALTFAGLILLEVPFNKLGVVYGNNFFFDGYSSVTVVLSSVAAFLLLSKFPRSWPGNSKPWFSRLVRFISENTLAIFFMHQIVLQVLNSGTLGIRISVLNIPSPIEIPIATVCTLFICLGLIAVIKKIPIGGKLIG
jgi:surface polysaccharide O-acyltransferase-like enzyme